MRRISLSLRLVLIVVGAMFLLQVVAIGVLVSRDDGFTLGGIRPSFAREVAGLVRLFERLPPRREAVALEFLNAGRFGVEIATAAPRREPDGLLFGMVAPGIERRIAEEGVPLDRVDASFVVNAASGQSGPLARLFGRHLRITVALNDGGYLVIDPSSEVDGYVYGNLLAIGAGLIGLLILGGAVFAVVRETRPLAALAANVESFARTATPRDVAEAGAPELRSLIRATNRMQHQIAALIRNRALILAGMSHDLRTQVTRLRLRLELLPESEARTRAIVDIEAMQALIEETLEFAAAGSSADGGRTDANALLERMRDERASFGNLTYAAGVETEVAIAETPLRRVVENLVENAIKYGERADLTLVVDAETARIEVADRGPGIAVAEREHIFEPFYRLETSRSRSHGGTGLGLAIVQQIVDRHGGRIEVGDRPGGGALFTVTLPLA